MSETIHVRRPRRPITATLRPPGSKSLSNRALLLAALATGRTRIEGCLDAEDTQLMLACLARLGIAVERDGPELADGLELDGSPRLGSAAGVPALDVGTAGTVARFLTAALAGAPSPSWDAVIVDGTPRMRERPMDALLSGLEQLGAVFEWLGHPGALPLRVLGGRGLAGGEVVLERPASSQFVSALLIAGCRARGPVRIVLREGTPARPYVDMTLALIETFGGDAGWSSSGGDALEVRPRGLRACPRYVVEPDASAASYLLALPVIWGGEVTIPALGSDSLQGDAQFCRVLERFGARVELREHETTVRGVRGAPPLRGRDLDLSEMPDMTLTAAVVALFAEGPTRIRGVEVLRHHESDRLAAGATELRKLGAEVTEHEGGLDIVPPAGGPRPAVVIDTYLDHRMAMAFAMVGEVEIADPRCVDKTFPRYFEVLAELGMGPEASC
ncbi:3-phosphoshikimate 1-carboxyvinyltransferase [Enhygromyxa salina]|uniref:3-phosphoshikimate 1-carboxyvinyltransferase n=1 Tax=Enhygromyxa salina TaxID=215803 RepID=A0A2S9XRR1_9BACT|nr:3-phosphoshikimate 1-carboxyvinyltransferase [Enhygromyxa salina]PRP95430.1 3-phosphoshikimate 1-carboxyvinyltransferase [Enhygromyxa salina]